MNINDVKLCSASKLVENALGLFLGSLKTNHQQYIYNFRPRL